MQNMVSTCARLGLAGCYPETLPFQHRLGLDEVTDQRDSESAVVWS